MCITNCKLSYWFVELNQLLWCKNPKTGSTLMRNLIRVTNHVDFSFVGCGFAYPLCCKGDHQNSKHPTGNEMLVKIVWFPLANIPQAWELSQKLYDVWFLHPSRIYSVFSSAVWFILFRLTVLICEPPGFKQALYLLALFLYTQSSRLEMLAVFLWKLSFSSCKITDCHMFSLQIPCITGSELVCCNHQNLWLWKKLAIWFCPQILHMTLCILTSSNT